MTYKFYDFLNLTLNSSAGIDRSTLSRLSKQEPLTLNDFSSVLHLLSKHRTDYQLYVLDERIMAVIITIQAHLIRVNNVVIIPYLPIPDLTSYQYPLEDFL